MSAAPDSQDRRSAVALHHRRGGEGAPRVVARGRGESADRILALAAEHDIPVREDRDLVELLAACELGQEIPEELFGVVAEILAFLYRLNGELGEGPGSARAT